MTWYDTDDPEVSKLWSKMLWSEYRKRDALFDPANGFTGPGEDSPFILLDDFQKSAGDRLTIPLSFQIAGRGVTGNEVLEGKELPIETEVFNMVIDKQRQGVRTFGEMVDQRVHFNAFDEGKRKLADWCRTRRAVSAMNHLCGATYVTDPAFTGLNPVSAPDDQHIFRIGGVSAEETITATESLGVREIDKLVTLAELSTPPIRPFNFKGNYYYALFLHPDQVNILRETDTDWYNTMQNAIAGGAIDDNPLFTRALGKWRDCLIFSDPHITRGVDSTTGEPVDGVRRAVLVGASALAIGYGRHYGHGDSKFRWFNSTWDHGDKYYASASLIWGLKATRFTVDGVPRDYAKIVIPSWAPETVVGIGDIGQDNN